MSDWINKIYIKTKNIFHDMKLIYFTLYKLNFQYLQLLNNLYANNQYMPSFT